MQAVYFFPLEVEISLLSQSPCLGLCQNSPTPSRSAFFLSMPFLFLLLLVTPYLYQQSGPCNLPSHPQFTSLAPGFLPPRSFTSMFHFGRSWDKERILLTRYLTGIIHYMSSCWPHMAFLSAFLTTRIHSHSHKPSFILALSLSFIASSYI